jgi:hypothetical protein
MNAIKLMTAADGDLTVATWDPADAGQVKEAADVFIRLMGEGKAGFITTKRDASGEMSAATLVREFDPHAEEIIFCEPFAGG